jgi:hypothetical protein
LRRREQRIAVRRALGRGVGADVAARARPVLDDDPHLPFVAELLPSVRARMSMPFRA